MAHKTCATYIKKLLFCDNWWKKSEGNWLTLVNVEMATEMEEFEGTPTPVPCPLPPAVSNTYISYIHISADLFTLGHTIN